MLRKSLIIEAVAIRIVGAESIEQQIVLVRVEVKLVHGRSCVASRQTLAINGVFCGLGCVWISPRLDVALVSRANFRWIQTPLEVPARMLVAQKSLRSRTMTHDNRPF